MHWHGHMIAGRLGSAADDDEYLGRVYDHKVVTRLMAYLRPHAALVVVSTLTMLVYTATLVATPWLIKLAIDTFIMRGDLAGLQFIVLLFLGNALLNYGSQYVHLVTLARVSQRVLYDLRTHLFDHLQTLPVSFYDRNEVGRIMSRVQNDVQQLQEFLSIVVLSLGDLLSLVGIVVALFWMNAQLAAITLSVLPVLILIMAVWQTYARASFMRVRRAIAAVNGALQENISGVRVVQSLNREDVNIRRFQRVNEDHLEANLQASRLSSALLPMAEVLMAVAMGLVVLFGGSMVLNGALEVGALVAFLMYIQRFFDPIRNLTMQYAQLQRAMASGSRIFGLMDVKPELTDAPDAVELPPIRGELRYEGVTFSYVPGIPVLRDINLGIRPGQTVALVGVTGAGKTSMAALAARFYDVTEGRITVDGYDLRGVKRGSLARQMGVVLQEPFLFSGTVRENIRYCHTEATDEDVVRAAQAVGAHDFITRLDRGYDTVLQERGGNLSVGQRQLISLARAVAADPRILILDEATANVDSHTEMLIQQALKRLLSGRTAIVIAHRLSTIRNADQIVVLDQGRIVEAGAHRELLERGGHYARLYEMSFGEAAATAGDGREAVGDGVASS